MCKFQNLLEQHLISLFRNVPEFAPGNGTSNGPTSNSWKNSIRHNLSLHSRFQKIQNCEPGKSSNWALSLQENTAPVSRTILTVPSMFCTFIAGSLFVYVLSRHKHVWDISSRITRDISIHYSSGKHFHPSRGFNFLSVRNIWTVSSKWFNFYWIKILILA